MSTSKSLWNINLGEEKDDKGFEKYRKKLPSTFQNLYPLRAVISGSSGSGKTHVIKRLVYHYYKPVLSAVFLFSGTETTIEEFEKIHKKMKEPFVLKTFNTYSDDKVNEIVETMKETRKPSLFIFEDLIYKNIMGKQKNNAIDRLYTTGRHYNINVITTSQRYTMLNPQSRMNNANLILVFNANSKEIETLYNEHGNNLSQEEFKDAFNKAVDEKHKFFCIDYTETDFHKRLKDSEFNPVCFNIKDDLKDEFSSKSNKKSYNQEVKDVFNDNKDKSIKIKQVKKADDGIHKYILELSIDGETQELPFGDINSKTLSRDKVLKTIKDIRSKISSKS
jgi:hypothetical protein